MRQNARASSGLGANLRISPSSRLPYQLSADASSQGSKPMILVLEGSGKDCEVAVSKVNFVMQVLGGRRSEEVSKGKQKLKSCEVLFGIMIR